MPDSQEPKPKIDLSRLQMMPDWAMDLEAESESESTTSAGGYGQEQSEPRRGRSRPSEHDRRRRNQDRRDQRRGDDRRDQRRGDDRRDQRRGDDRRDQRRGGPPHSRRGQDRYGPQRGHDRQRQRPALPQGVMVRVKTSPKALEALSVQIKRSGRAFGLFDLAKFVLARRDLYQFEFSAAKDNPKEFYRCKSDQALWLNRDDAIRHSLDYGNLDDFYAIEEKEVDPPKGNYRTIALCGMSGTILGPPNHHLYQSAVLRLHRRRFPNMSLEKFKSRIKIEADEAKVEEWRESQSKQTLYLYPKEPSEGEEQVRLESQEELERHAFAHLASKLVEPAKKSSVPGDVVAKQLDPGLWSLMRRELDHLHRSPFPLVKTLCSQLESRGLKIFKRQGKKLFVSKARPRHINPSVKFSDSIQHIVELVRDRPGIKVTEMTAKLAPRSQSEPPPAAPSEQEAEEPDQGEPSQEVKTSDAEPPEEAKPPEAETSEEAKEPEAEKPEAKEPEAKEPEAEEPEAEEPEAEEPEAKKPEAKKPEAKKPEAKKPEAKEPEAKKPEAKKPEAKRGEAVQHVDLTPEETAVLSDLHWLIDEGYIIEYASSALFLGAQPQPPAKNKKKARPAAKAAITAQTRATSEPAKTSPPAQSSEPKARKPEPETPESEPETPESERKTPKTGPEEETASAHESA